MVLPDSEWFLLNNSKKSLRKKALKPYPFFEKVSPCIVIIVRKTRIQAFTYNNFTK